MEGYRAAIRLVIAFALLIALILNLFTDRIVMTFLGEEGTRTAMETGIGYLRFMSVFFCLIGFKISVDGLLRGDYESRMNGYATGISNGFLSPNDIHRLENMDLIPADQGGEVITVCGAGGNRDKGKRPLMAQEAVKQSDKVIITSDNPRFEEPQDIINDMLAGLNAQQMKKVISIVDRKEAIRTACMMAKKGDVILVAGKGHEDYQEIKGVKHHFDDKEVIREIFGINK